MKSDMWKEMTLGWIDEENYTQGTANPTEHLSVRCCHIAAKRR
jgi:hypothetical protein